MRQLMIFLNAVMFYTRIPVPSWMTHDEVMLNKATIYFPVIGWIVGGVAALSLWGFGFLWPWPVAVLLSMIVSVLLTGAFHEDGFSDVCDGFGGGWTQLRILEIMKDSRVGVYGVAGLGLMLGLKFLLLQSFGLQQALIALVLAHPLSRFTALTFIYTHEYCREDALSKVKPLAKQLQLSEMLLALVFAVIPLLGLVIWQSELMYLGVAIPLVLVKLYLGRYFQKWIQGYTGDCLGATQQVAEVVVYLYLSVLWKFI
jgi:adenosylcobinamide-GDP ribazoletransferase